MSSFSAIENKSLLWKLMIDSNSFSGLPENNYDLVKSIFEKEIVMQSALQAGKSLTDMNKVLLLEVTKKLNPLRTTDEIINHTISQITSNDISKQRQTQFSKNLLVKQSDFNEHITAMKPENIDFSDITKDKPIGADMSNIITNTIAQREQQFNTATASHNTDAATKWIGNGIKPERKSVPTLTIGHNETTDVKERTGVTFAEPTINLLEFLNAREVPPVDTLRIIKEMKAIYKEMSASMVKLNNMIKMIEDSQ